MIIVPLWDGCVFSTPKCSYAFTSYTHIHVLPGVEVEFKDSFYEVLICPSQVPELAVMEVVVGGLLVGAAVSLTQLSTKLQELICTLPGGR